MKINNEKTNEQLQEELRKTKEDLEIHKWAIKKSNTSLQFLLKENTDKTEGLLNKIKELESINEDMIGREVKMVELKKEIEELKKPVKKSR